MVEIIKVLFEEIIICIALGGGGLLIGFFRKLYKSNNITTGITTLKHSTRQSNKKNSW